MRIHFFGAARIVTGSNYLLEVNGHGLLLECGFYQGHRDEVVEIHGFSAHAGQDPLVKYAQAAKGLLKQVVLVHGESKPAEAGIVPVIYPDMGSNSQYENW